MSTWLFVGLLGSRAATGFLKHCLRKRNPLALILTSVGLLALVGVIAWERTHREPHARILRGHTTWVRAVAFAPDG
jgi:hypothetical protein